MGWERRQRGGQYFYRSVRLGGVPRKLYVGRGPAAKMLAKAVAQRRQQAEAERAARRAEQARLAPADAALADLAAWTGLLVRAALVLQGFHEHRGEWRRWRYDMSRRPKGSTTARPRKGSAGARAAADPGQDRAAFSDLVARANAGDRAALDDLRALLDRRPEIAEAAGDLARCAEGVWTDLLVGEDALRRESVQRRLAALGADLAGEHATELEKLLVDEILVCYLAKQYATIAAAQPSAGLGQARLRLRRAESAQRRFFAAVKTLAGLRALMPQGLVPTTRLRVYTEESAARRRA